VRAGPSSLTRTAVISTDPARPAITAYGATRYAESCSARTPTSRGAARKYAAATSSGPTAPETAIPTFPSARRAAGQPASAPMTRAEPSASPTPGRYMLRNQ
jgi:hypothetical protein